MESTMELGLALKGLGFIIVSIVIIYFLSRKKTGPVILPYIGSGRTSAETLNFFKNLEREIGIGFDKRIILFDFLPESCKDSVLLNGWLDGIWINYKDKLIKFREDSSSKNYNEIRFKDIEDVSVNKTDDLSKITIQFVTRDSNDCPYIYKLKLSTRVPPIISWSPYSQAYVKCLNEILHEMRIISKFR